MPTHSTTKNFNLLTTRKGIYTENIRSEKVHDKKIPGDGSDYHLVQWANVGKGQLIMQLLHYFELKMCVSHLQGIKIQ